LLIGKVINTNASWLAQRLTEMGIKIRRILSVPDEEGEIIEVIRAGLSKCRIIILTGGLGPTYDDITNIALAKALNRKLVINPDAFREIEEKYRAQGLPLTDVRIKMSKMPEGSISLYNPVGTAPGILIEINNKLIVALPGVPAEMKAIFQEHLLGRLTNYTDSIYLEDRFIVKGIPESKAAPVLRDAYQANPSIYIKSHPKGAEFNIPILEIHLSTIGKDKEKLKKGLQETKEMLIRRLQDIGGKIE